jgi:Tfp pilus assembly protein PilX
MNIRTNERGSALLISLCLLAMLTLIGIMALQNTNTEVDLAYNKSQPSSISTTTMIGGRDTTASV